MSVVEQSSCHAMAGARGERAHLVRAAAQTEVSTTVEPGKTIFPGSWGPAAHCAVMAACPAPARAPKRFARSCPTVVSGP